MNKNSKEMIEKVANCAKNGLIKYGKLAVPVICTAACNWVCSYMTNEYGVSLKMDKKPTNDYYVLDNPEYSDAVYAIMHSDMTSYDKREAVDKLVPECDHEYYASIIHIAKSSGSTSYDKREMIHKMSRKIQAL